MKLTYFDFPGRAEAIRDALRIGGLPFVDVRVSGAEFQALRASGALPFDGLPVLELDNGLVLAQSNTILRHVGRRAGLVPEDATAALRVDMLLDAAEDYGGRLSVSIRVSDATVRAALREELAQRWLPDWCRHLERSLAVDAGGWLVGSTLTIADLKVVHAMDKLINGSLSGIPTDLLAPFPALEAWLQRVHAERARRLPR
jgi:glutathione S-transferase